MCKNKYTFLTKKKWHLSELGVYNTEDATTHTYTHMSKKLTENRKDRKSFTQ